MDLCGPGVKVEHLMIPLPHTSAQPRTMMIMHRDTAVTDATVEHSWSLDDVAGWASLALDLVFLYCLEID